MSDRAINNTGSKEIVPYISQDHTKKEEEKTDTPIQSLPDYVLKRIFHFLSPKDLGSVSCLNHFWHNLSDSNDIWIYPCKEARFISVKYKDNYIKIRYRDKKYVLKEGKSSNFNAKETYKAKTAKRRAPKRKARQLRDYNFKNSLLFQLPSEVLQRIFSHVPPRGLTSLALTSALIKPLVDNHVWIYPCEKEGFLALKQEENGLKIQYRGQEFYLQEKGQDEFDAKKIFRKQMKGRVSSVVRSILSKRTLGKEKVEELKHSLLAPSFYDTERKEQEIYDTLKITAEALVKKAWRAGPPESGRQEMEKKARFVLAFKTGDPQVVASVLKRDSLQNLPDKKFCEKLELETPERYALQSDNLELFQIMSDLGFIPTEENLIQALIFSAAKITRELIKAAVLTTEHLTQAAKPISELSESIFKISENNPHKTKGAKDLRKLEKLLNKQREWIELITLLCDRLQTQGSNNEENSDNKKIDIEDHRHTRLFWSRLLDAKNLDLVKKIDSIVERPAPNVMIDLAFETKNPEIMFYFFQDHITGAAKKETLQSMPDEDQLENLWEEALELHDLEFIKKMETVFVRPGSILELACDRGDIAIITHFLNQKLPVTTECFNTAFALGNKELVSLFFQYSSSFNPDRYTGYSVIAGNNLELVQYVANIGYLFKLVDLLALRSDEQGNQILEFLKKENKISFNLNNHAHGHAFVISRLSEAENPQLLSFLYEKKILGNARSLITHQAKDVIKNLRPNRKKLDKSFWATIDGFKSLKSDSNTLRHHLVEWVELYDKNKRKPEKYCTQYTQAVERVKFLFKQGIKTDDLCNRLMFKHYCFNKDIIKAVIEELDFPIPKDVYSIILNATIKGIDVFSKNYMEKLSEILSYLSSKNIRPRKQDLRILQNAIKVRSSPKQYKKIETSSSGSTELVSSDDEANKIRREARQERRQKRRVKELDRLNQILAVLTKSNSEKKKTDK